jgi:hypothetical protein
MSAMESKPMEAGELGRYVCVVHGGCLHSPHLTITSGGVWVRSPAPDPLSQGRYLYSSAHRDCFEAWAAREAKTPCAGCGGGYWQEYAGPPAGSQFIPHAGDCERGTGNG